MKALVIDIGGTNVKILATGQKERRKFPSGPGLTPAQMVAGVRKLAGDWKYDVVSMGYPGLVRKGRIVLEPHNLAPGWVGFDFKAAFQRPVKVINDAAMQALGSYRKGTMLFLGLGTGLGAALVVEGVVVPMELAHLDYKQGTYEDYLGLRAIKRLGEKRWNKHLEFCVARLIAALHLDDVVLGGGNAKRLNQLPEGCRPGDNAYAFLGGYRLWAKADEKRRRPAQARTRPAARKVGRRQAPAAKPGTKPASVPAIETPPSAHEAPAPKPKMPTL